MLTKKKIKTDGRFLESLYNSTTQILFHFDVYFSSILLEVQVLKKSFLNKKRNSFLL